MKKIAILLITLLSCTAKKESKIASTDSKTTQIVNFLDSLEEFSGAVLIAKQDCILVKKAYGYAHLGHKVKNTTSTKFAYSSIGKSFTAVAIFQLIQKGKLSLDDTVGKFIPDYPNPKIRDAVTIRHLLTHRSGVPNYATSEQLKNVSKDRFRTVDDLAPLYENTPMESEPDATLSYRNTNYVLLGRVIESVSGMKYEDYIKENIFIPAKMSNTGLYDTDHPIDNAAEGYTLSDIYPGKYKKNIFMIAVKGNAAGGGYTTVEDLFKFTVAFDNGVLLKKEYSDLMKTRISSKDWYGYGMLFPSTTDANMYGHLGSQMGAGSEWRVYGEQNYTVILLTNKDAQLGFSDARFYIQKTIAGSNPMIDSYFLTKEVVQTCFDKGLDEAKNLIDRVEGKVSVKDLNAKGYEMIKRGEYEKAINIFQLEVYVSPESYSAFDALGEAYMKAGDKAKAKENYEKSLALNSGNEHAKEKLKELSTQ